jgi:RNA polymerase sigma-70 factor (ECF subfamily)
VVELNRAIAIAETGETDAALGVVDALDLEGYYLFHATRAELLDRLGRAGDAAAAYRRALDLTSNAAERAHLEGRLADVSARA